MASIAWAKLGMDAIGAVGLIGTGVQAYSEISKINENKEYNQSVLEQQQAQIQSQKEISASQSKTKQRLLAGKATTQAGASGLKLTGSLAQSLSQSMTAIGVDEGINQYNLGLQSAGVTAQSQISNLQSQSATTGSLGTTLMQGANFTKKYWRK